MGVPVKSDLHVAKNATYTSNKSIQEMLYCISEVIESRVLNELHVSEHFSLMFDETTDCTITEQLAIHGRYIDKQTGELKTCYLSTIDVLGPELEAIKSGGDTDTCISLGASTITKRILERTGLDMTKLRGIGTDGAATMTGCRTGVVVRLKQITPSAIGVHCAAHRLNLASSQAVDKVQYVKKNILRQLFDYYDNSSVRSAGLQAIQLLTLEKGRLLPNCTTRWLSTERSVMRPKSCYISVVLSLQNDSENWRDAKALGLASLMSEYRFVYTMLLFCDTLPHITFLSKAFQDADCDYSIIPKMLSITLQSLEALQLTDGTNLLGLESYVEELTAAGIQLKMTPVLGHSYSENSVKKPYLANLIQNLKNRFEDKSIITAFDLFNPTSIPSDPTELVQFGNDNVRQLSEYYKNSAILTGTENCLAEWSSCKQLIQNTQFTKHGEVIHYLSTDPSMHRMYPNLCTLAQICRVVPIHSADVERSFSQLKLVKTNIRNRMFEKTLDSLLRITIEGPEVNEFHVKDAVTLWASKKNRRIR